jgi:hypothetical protein
MKGKKNQFIEIKKTKQMTQKQQDHLAKLIKLNKERLTKIKK